MKKRRRGGVAVGVRAGEADQQCADGEPDVCAAIRYQLRVVQNITGCSTRVLNLVLQKLQPFLKGCEQVKHFQMTRVRARKKSPIKRQMHGCVGCDSFVFGPKCPDSVCPRCGQERYDAKGKANEVVLAFDLSFLLACVVCILLFFLVTCDTFLHFA